MFGKRLDLSESLFSRTPTLSCEPVPPPEAYERLNSNEAATLPLHPALPEPYQLGLAGTMVAPLP
jgi:hypothetical protein